MDGLRSSMWIGSTHSKVECIVQKVLEKAEPLPKPMAMYREEDCILMPGEYIENPWYFSALLVTSYDMDLVVFVYDCDEPYNPFPPACANAFNRDSLGILVVDYERHNECPTFLMESIGVNHFVVIDKRTYDGIDEVRQYLKKDALT